MNELIDETPYVRVLADNGGFVLPEVAAIHDMRKKQLPTFPAILNVLSLKDISNNPFHRLFKPRHSQLLYHPISIKVKVNVFQKKVIIHHLP